MPITLAAYELTEEAGFYKKIPGRDIAVQAAHQQAADRELQGPAPRQLRADPRRHRRGARGGVVRQEGRQGRARRRGEARQRAAAQVRGGQQVGRASRLPRSGDWRAPLPHGGGGGRDRRAVDREVEKRVIFNDVAALPAGGAADRGDAGLLLLAARPGDLAVGAASRTPFGGNSHVRLVRQFRAAVQRSELLRVGRGHRGVQRRWSPRSGSRSRCCWR